MQEEEELNTQHFKGHRGVNIIIQEVKLQIQRGVIIPNMI